MTALIVDGRDLRMANEKGKRAEGEKGTGAAANAKPNHSIHSQK
jgi:hypothetical protein